MDIKGEKKELSKSREKLEKEYTICLKEYMDAFYKRNNLLPVFNDTPNGIMATLVVTLESLAEYDKADQEERKTSARLRETLQKLWDINARLQN